MNGKRRWVDNVFIERLWRSLKYEDVFIKGYADGTELRAGVVQWLASYDHARLHQALGNRPAMAVRREATTPQIFRRPHRLSARGAAGASRHVDFRPCNGVPNGAAPGRSGRPIPKQGAARGVAPVSAHR